MTTKTNIDFALLGLATKQFAIIEDNFVEDGNIKFRVSFNFGTNPNERTITVMPVFQFECNENIFLMIEAGCHYRIEEKAWNTMIKKEVNKLMVSKGFIQHLAMLAIGTARGILHAKTENTKYNRFIIPPINVTNFIKEDVVFDLPQEEKELS